jgi:hypothetical protein
MVSAIRGIQQSLSARSDISLAVQQQVANFLTQFSSTGFKGSNDFAALGVQELFEKV